MRWVRVSIAGALVASFVLASAVAAKPPAGAVAERTQALREAEQLWAQQALSSYRYRIQISCFCPQIRPAVVTVESGRPAETRRPFRRLNTVEKLFEYIRGHLHDDNLGVQYSSRGVPRLIASDPSFQIADEEVSYGIDRFRVLSG